MKQVLSFGLNLTSLSELLHLSELVSLFEPGPWFKPSFCLLPRHIYLDICICAESPLVSWIVAAQRKCSLKQ